MELNGCVSKEDQSLKFTYVIHILGALVLQLIFMDCSRLQGHSFQLSNLSFNLGQKICFTSFPALFKRELLRGSRF